MIFILELKKNNKMYNGVFKQDYIEKYLEDYDIEKTKLGERYIYNKEKAKENWEKIELYIDKGLAKPIEFKWTDDGYQVPYGKDCFLHEGELMPDGVISTNSIFYRDPYGDFPWLGNYYSLKYKLLSIYSDLPFLKRYDIETERNLKIIKEITKDKKKNEEEEEEIIKDEEKEI